MKLLSSMIVLLVIVLQVAGDAQPGLTSYTYSQPLFAKDTTDLVSTDSINVLVNDKSLNESASSEETKADEKSASFSKNGIASFYSKSLEGTLTATGERFHHSNLTGASNFFPLNTWVKVTNLKNNKSVVVRINDRMHPAMAKKGRVVDLTITAARKIGLTALTGITKVKVEVVDPVTTAKQ